MDGDGSARAYSADDGDFGGGMLDTMMVKRGGGEGGSRFYIIAAVAVVVLVLLAVWWWRRRKATMSGGYPADTVLKNSIAAAEKACRPLTSMGPGTDPAVFAKQYSACADSITAIPPYQMFFPMTIMRRRGELPACLPRSSIDSAFDSTYRILGWSKQVADTYPDCQGS